MKTQEDNISDGAEKPESAINETPNLSSKETEVEETKNHSSKTSTLKADISTAKQTTNRNTHRKDPIVHEISIDGAPSSEYPMKKVIVFFALAIILGVMTGFGVSYVRSYTHNTTTDSSLSTSEEVPEDVIETAGIADKETFKDSAEGVLEAGGHESGEGSFKLIRNEDDDSQTAYLTSSTVDMSNFVGKKVRVYGETFASENVGWLMDVGYIEVIK